MSGLSGGEEVTDHRILLEGVIPENIFAAAIYIYMCLSTQICSGVSFKKTKHHLNLGVLRTASFHRQIPKVELFLGHRKRK